VTRYYNKTLKEEENRRSKKYLTMMRLGVTTKPKRGGETKKKEKNLKGKKKENIPQWKRKSKVWINTNE
jgi:hypothetical protein